MFWENSTYATTVRQVKKSAPSAGPAMLSVCAILAYTGCGSHKPSASGTAAIAVPERARTAGDGLMELAPMGADLVVELDIARLHESPILGPIVARLSSAPVTAGEWQEAVDITVLDRVESMVLVAYHVGEDRAEAIVLLRSAVAGVAEGVAEDLPGTRIDERTHVLGPPEWIARVLAVHRREQPSLTADRELMAVRTRAMPERAPGAFLRVAARLDFDARVALAAQFELDQVPATMSLWADVADDLAVVATLSGTEPRDGRALAQALHGIRAKVAAMPWIRAKELHSTVRSIDIAAAGERARVVLIVGPRRLRRMVSRLGQALQSLQPSVSP